jgi:hypothetical protein
LSNESFLVVRGFYALFLTTTCLDISLEETLFIILSVVFIKIIVNKLAMSSLCILMYQMINIHFSEVYFYRKLDND